MRVRTWLFDHFRSTSLAFGFEEWDAPVLENESLYTRKAGEEITEQLYCFEDTGGRRVSLRPELTPSLARMVLGKGPALPLPAKWFAIGQCWRYERMTRGRRREHYQWNMDIFGEPSVAAEAELLASICTFFSRLGLTAQDVGLKVSSRLVLQEVCRRAHIPAASFGPVCVVVDKADKISRAELLALLALEQVEGDAAAAVLDALEITHLAQLSDLLGADSPVVQELTQLFDLVGAYGFADWLVLDTSVVRGLAYYTGTVFEGFDREGRLRAICGGGRYDQLLSTFGGDRGDVPACGFGFGDAVIYELLVEKKLIPERLATVGVHDVVVDISPEGGCGAEVRQVAGALRGVVGAGGGRRVDVVLGNKKMKWVFKHADRVGAERLFLLGGRDAPRGFVTVRDCATRQEVTVPLTELPAAPTA